MAALELRGRAGAPRCWKSIGQLSPTADPLALDIRAEATDLELAPLSPMPESTQAIPSGAAN